MTEKHSKLELERKAQHVFIICDGDIFREVGKRKDRGKMKYAG